MESGAISPRQLDAGHRQALLTSQDAAVRARVEMLMAGLVNSDRVAVIAQFQSAAGLTGDAALGRNIYEERCATCHKVGETGFVVGPDLAAAGSGSFETLLTAILDPNRAVEGRYTAYTVETHDFQSFSGVLTGESANSITLANAGGLEQTVLRSDIASMEAGDQSIMPEGLEEGLVPEDMAHLIAFIRGGNQTPKSFEGNTPALVVADGAGTLELSAKNAEIYGETLAYEPTYRNLGYWGSASDHAVWRVKVPATGHLRGDNGILLRQQHRGESLPAGSGRERAFRPGSRHGHMGPVPGGVYRQTRPGGRGTAHCLPPGRPDPELSHRPARVAAGTGAIAFFEAI